MTNREWLKSLNNKELSCFLSKLLSSDRSCAGDGSLEKCHRQPSYGKLKWIQMEHKERDDD